MGMKLSGWPGLIPARLHGQDRAVTAPLPGGFLATPSIRGCTEARVHPRRSLTRRSLAHDGQAAPRRDVHRGHARVG